VGTQRRVSASPQPVRAARAGRRARRRRRPLPADTRRPST